MFTFLHVLPPIPTSQCVYMYHDPSYPSLCPCTTGTTGNSSRATSYADTCYARFKKKTPRKLMSFPEARSSLRGIVEQNKSMIPAAGRSTARKRVRRTSSSCRCRCLRRLLDAQMRVSTRAHLLNTETRAFPGEWDTVPQIRLKYPLAEYPPGGATIHGGPRRT